MRFRGGGLPVPPGSSLSGPWPSGCRKGSAAGAELSDVGAGRVSRPGLGPAPKPTGPPGPHLPASGPRVAPGHTRATRALHAHSPRAWTQGSREQDTGASPTARLTACSSSRLSLESSALRVDSAPWTPRPSVTLVSFSPSVGAHGYDQGPGSLPGHWPCCWGQARPSHMAGPGQEGQRLPPRPLLPQLPRATRHPALQRGRCWVLLPCPTAAAWSPLPSSPSPWRV